MAKTACYICDQELDLEAGNSWIRHLQNHTELETRIKFAEIQKERKKKNMGRAKGLKNNKTMVKEMTEANYVSAEVLASMTRVGLIAAYNDFKAGKSFSVVRAAEPVPAPTEEAPVAAVQAESAVEESES